MMGDQQEVFMTKQYNAAIIGCGAIHSMHTAAMKQLPDVRIAAVCDNKPERARAAAEAYGCTAYTDYHEMLSDSSIDAVHICTPHYLHARMAIDALNAGKYVLCEKPMATTVADARAMIAADERQGGGHLCIIFQNRYNQASRKMREIISGGQFGALQCLRGSVVWIRTPVYYSDDWHGKKALEGGGVMINQAIHTLDVVQWLGGGAASIKGSVSIDSLQGIIEVEDTAHARIVMKSGVPAVFYATVAYGIDSPIEIEAVLEDGRFLIRGESLYRLDDNCTCLCAPDGAPIGQKDYWGTGHLAQVGDFYRCIAEGKPFAIDGTEGIEAIKLICGLYESSASGREVSI
jgi:UDP-N-acetyl-2-amino-2-deoxyglucuronate dehydrogenase